MRIHEGLIWSNRDKRTLLDKMLALLGILALGQPFYFVADAYYASGKIINGLLEQGQHLVTRMRSNAVAYRPVVARDRGEEVDRNCMARRFTSRPCSATKGAANEPSPVYGEKDVSCNTGCVICCGARRGASSASSR